MRLVQATLCLVLSCAALYCELGTVAALFALVACAYVALHAAHT